jgi:hypothetical protein
MNYGRRQGIRRYQRQRRNKRTIKSKDEARRLFFFFNHPALSLSP